MRGEECGREGGGFFSFSVSWMFLGGFGGVGLGWLGRGGRVVYSICRCEGRMREEEEEKKRKKLTGIGCRGVGRLCEGCEGEYTGFGGVGCDHLERGELIVFVFLFLAVRL